MLAQMLPTDINHDAFTNRSYFFSSPNTINTASTKNQHGHKEHGKL